MPFLTATYGYGIDSTLTGFGSLNITSAVYGNLQMEIGATKRLLQQQGYFPAISINPMANIIYRNKDASAIYPELDLNAYWDYNRGRNFFYISISNWLEFKQKRAFEEKQQNHWLITPVIGETFVRRKWNYKGIYKEAHRIPDAEHNSVPNTMGFKNYLETAGSFIIR